MIVFETIEGKPSPQKLEQIKAFYQSIFTEIHEEEFVFRTNNTEKLFTVLAFSDNQIVGFKLGYQLDSAKFYSWIGGVKEEFRKQGIGDELMKRQHQWCKNQGFQTIQTKTQNRFKPMLILNIKNGFDVVDVQQNEQNEIKIVLEKSL